MEKRIAKDLLSIGAVFLRPEEPFTWASGIKSPIYCDNRLTLTAPSVRDDVENGLAEVIKREYPECEVLMGTSTAGIAHAAITAHLMNLPMGYVRSGAKDHGRTNQIEGKLEKGSESRSGGRPDLHRRQRHRGGERAAGGRGGGAGHREHLYLWHEKRHCADGGGAGENVSVSNFDVLVEVAAEEGYIAKEDVARLIAFRSNPSDEGWRNA